MEGCTLTTSLSSYFFNRFFVCYGLFALFFSLGLEKFPSYSIVCKAFCVNVQQLKPVHGMFWTLESKQSIRTTFPLQNNSIVIWHTWNNQLEIMNDSDVWTKLLTKILPLPFITELCLYVCLSLIWGLDYSFRVQQSFWRLAVVH